MGDPFKWTGIPKFSSLGVLFVLRLLGFFFFLYFNAKILKGGKWDFCLLFLYLLI